MPPRLASLPSRSRLAGEHSDRLLTYGQVAGGNVSLTDRRRRRRSTAAAAAITLINISRRGAVLTVLKTRYSQ